MDRLSLYDYALPEELIAQAPLADRSASRLLVLDKKTGAVAHRSFGDCLDILQPGDLLVMNDTRVTARRLFGRKGSGGKVEALLLREVEPQVWEALVKPGRRVQGGTEIRFDSGLAVVTDVMPDGRRLLHFDHDPSGAGLVPLPPYINEALADAERYQTVYNQHGGSSAAPTAGLHFTHALLAALQSKGVQVAYVTLDVGLDTFRPVHAEDLDDHEMHGERCTVPPETAEAIRQATGRIIAVGTTTARTLESMAVGPRKVDSGDMTTTIFIRPGFEFSVVDGMFTNFHMPRTTMLMMLSALAGRDNVLRAYAEAIVEGYRFLSFGDSMLIV